MGNKSSRNHMAVLTRTSKAYTKHQGAVYNKIL